MEYRELVEEWEWSEYGRKFGLNDGDMPEAEEFQAAVARICAMDVLPDDHFIVLMETVHNPRPAGIRRVISYDPWDSVWVCSIGDEHPLSIAVMEWYLSEKANSLLAQYHAAASGLDAFLSSLRKQTGSE